MGNLSSDGLWSILWHDVGVIVNVEGNILILLLCLALARHFLDNSYLFQSDHVLEYI